MKRSKKTFNDQLVSSDRESGAVLKNSESKWGLNPMTLMGFIVLLMVLTVVFTVIFFFGDIPSDCLWTLAETRIFHVKRSKGATFPLFCFSFHLYSISSLLQSKFVENRMIGIEKYATCHSLCTHMFIMNKAKTKEQV